MFNLPPNIYNRYLEGLQNSQPAEKYSTVNPFRKVEGIGQYGNGLNASASQLYEHFSGGQHARGRKYWDHGLKPINPRAHIESAQEFAQRFNPQPQPVVPPPQAPTSSGYQNVVPHLGRFNPANNIFNIQPNATNPIESAYQLSPSFQAPTGGPPPNLASAQKMTSPMAMPSGGPAPQQAMPMPNMSAGIFNVPQFNRR